MAKDKEIEIPAEILPQYNQVTAALAAMPCNGQSGSVLSHLSAAAPRKIVAYLTRGAKPEMVIGVFTVINDRGDFADVHNGGAAAWPEIERLMRVGDGGGVSGNPNPTPSSNPTDPRTGNPYEPTFDVAEALRRERIDVGYMGNGLDPSRDLSYRTKPPAGYEMSAQATIDLVFGNGLDQIRPAGGLLPSGPAFAHVYAALTPEALLAMMRDAALKSAYVVRTETNS